MFGSLGTIWAEMGLDTTKLNMGCTKAAASLKGLDASGTKSVRTLSSTLLGIGAAAGVVAGVVAVASLKMAADFETSIAKTGALAGASKATMDKWGKSILEMSTKTSTGAKKIGDAWYWVVSNMPDATDAERFKTLEIAERGAIGGAAELADTVAALTVVQNAYADSGVELQGPIDYMDTMQTSVERGSLTLQDFVSNMGKVTGTAALAKVPFTEIGAAISTLTRKGVPVDTAFMALNQTMMTFLKPTDKAAKISKELGIDLSLTGLRAKGLAGSLMEIAEKVPDTELAELFPNIRALKAVLPLAGISVKDFATDLEGMGTRAGKADQMFETMSKTMGERMKTVINKIKKPMIELGTKLFPIIEKLGAALGRIFEGKNEAVNVFVSALKTLGTALWNVGAWIVRVKPLLYGLAAAFAAVKITHLVSGLTVAGGVIPGVVAAFGKLRFAIAALGVGGNLGAVFAPLAAALGAVALPAAAAAAALGLLWYQSNRNNAEGEKAHEIWRDVDKTLGDAAMRAQPLVTNIAKLREEMAGLVPGTAEYVAKAKQLQDAQNSLAQIYPGLIASVDEEGNAHAKSTKQLQDQIRVRMNLAGIKTTMKGEAGEYEALVSKRQNLNKAIEDGTTKIDQIQIAMQGLGATEEQATAVGELFGLSIGKGKDAMNALIVQLRETGAWTGTIQSMANLNGMAQQLDNTYKLAGGSTTQLQMKMLSLTSAITAQKGEIAAAAQAAGAAGKAIPVDIVTMFQSANKQLQVVGVESYAAYLRGVMSRAGMDPSKAAKLAQNLFNKGTFVNTGVAAVDAALAAMKFRMDAKKIGDIVGKAWGKISATFVTEEKKTTTVKVSEKGSKDTTDKLKKVKTATEGLNKVKGTVTALGNTSKANAAVSRLENRLAAINGKTLATVNIKAQIIGSGPFTADQYVSYLENKIGGAAPQVSVQMNTADLKARYASLMDSMSRGTGVLHPAKMEFEAMAEAILHTAVAAMNFDEIASDGIVPPDVGAQANLSKMAFVGLKIELDAMNASLKEQKAVLAASDAQINTWQHEITLAQQSVDKDRQSVEAHQRTIEKWNKELTAVNKKISEQQELLSKLSSIKLEGQTGAEEASFVLAQKSAQLQLQIMKAEDAHDYELFNRLTREKESLDRQREMADIQASITYDPQRRAIEQALDPLHGQEMAWQNIVTQIKAAQGEIDTQTIRQGQLNYAIGEEQGIIDGINDGMLVKEEAIQRINDLITEEQNRVWAAKVEVDNMTTEIGELQAAMDEMGRNAVQRWDEIRDAIIRAREAAATAAGGGAGPSYQTGGYNPVTQWAQIHAGEGVLNARAMQRLGMQGLSAMNRGQSPSDMVIDTPLHTHLYLDSRLIESRTTRITGGKASARRRSGGRY